MLPYACFCSVIHQSKNVVRTKTSVAHEAQLSACFIGNLIIFHVGAGLFGL